MSSFKKLNKADVTTVPYAANRRSNTSFLSTPFNSIVAGYTGINTPFSLSSTKTTNNQYCSLIYDQINHLFYQSFTSSLNTGSLMFNADTYASASQQRPTSSYFNYNTNPLLIKQFPTGAGDNINILSINKNEYGSKILPSSFRLYSAAAQIDIRDDGNGNLYDVYQAQNQAINLNFVTLGYVSTGNLIGTGIFFVGNIFYAHGLATITNQSSSYQSMINPSCTTFTIIPSLGSSVQYQYINCAGISTTTPSLTSQTNISVKTGTTPVKTFGNGSIRIGTISTNYPQKYLSFQNEHIIYENEVRCIVRESDFNLSYNPTLLKYGGQYISPISGSDGYTLTGSFDSTVKDFATGSFFQPYVTTIGLYNDENELLMVAKLGKPIALSLDTDMTFIVKYDT